MGEWSNGRKRDFRKNSHRNFSIRKVALHVPSGGKEKRKEKGLYDLLTV